MTKALLYSERGRNLRGQEPENKWQGKERLSGLQNWCQAVRGDTVLVCCLRGDKEVLKEITGFSVAGDAVR